MNKHTPLVQNEYRQHLRYGRSVYVLFVSKILALLLMSTFVIQPVTRALASEDIATSLPPAVILPVPVDSGVIKSPALPSEDITLNSTAEVVSTVSQVSASSSNTVASSSSLPTIDETLQIPLREATTTILIDTVTEQDIPNSESPGTDDQLISDELPRSTTTDPSVAVLTVESDKMVQFDKSDCVAVADGSFYCQPKKAEPLKSEDGLFAYPDSDGDLEIYLQRNETLKQVTFNTVDDAAPYFDSVSNTIVWHRQISERYQIMSYDIDGGTEIQLTSDTVNNMEPTRVGQYTAWQRWSGDNWDIVLFDGKETTILTTTLEHDIAPHIRGSLVVWNRISRDQKQTIEIYDIQTGEYTTIHDSDGGNISNPRMVMVYESSFENGDVVTKGYDMQTGEIADLTATPASVPDDIPPPDDTGETRALIQGKLPTKEDLEQSGTTTPKIGFDPEPEPENASTTTIVISSSTTPVLSPAPTASSSNLTLDLTVPIESLITEFELVVPAFVATSTEN